jgi:MFS family permease
MTQSENRYLYLLFVLCFLSMTFGALNSVLAASYLPDMVHDLAGIAADEALKGKVGAFISFFMLIGGSIGGISMGYLSDRIGRRTVLSLSLLCFSAGSAFGALSGSWEMLAFSRLIVGMGVGSTLVITAVIIAEAWPLRTRAIALGVLSVAYPAGIIGSGLITANVSSWRAGLWLGAATALIVIPVRWWVQESREWTAVRAQKEPVDLKPYRNEVISGILIYGTMLIGIWASFAWLPTWVQQLIGPETSAGQAQRGQSVMFLGMGGVVGGVFSGVLANWFGAKQVQQICFLVCFVLSYWLFEVNITYNWQVPLGITLLGLTFGVSQGVLHNYIPELFPTVVRSTATGLSFHGGRIFTAISVFFVGAFVVWFGGYGHAIFAFSTVYLLGLVAMFWVKHARSE